METPRRTRTYRSHHLDSERWDHVELRPGDVFMSAFNDYSAYTALTYSLQPSVSQSPDSTP